MLARGTLQPKTSRAEAQAPKEQILNPKSLPTGRQAKQAQMNKAQISKHPTVDSSRQSSRRRRLVFTNRDREGAGTTWAGDFPASLRARLVRRADNATLHDAFRRRKQAQRRGLAGSKNSRRGLAGRYAEPGHRKTFPYFSVAFRSVPFCSVRFSSVQFRSVWYSLVQFGSASRRPSHRLNSQLLLLVAGI